VVEVGRSSNTFGKISERNQFKEIKGPAEDAFRERRVVTSFSVANISLAASQIWE
jgi:hypothetical protein